MSAEDVLGDIDAETLRRRYYSRPDPVTDREFRCPQCHSRCTRLTDGVKEAGHAPDCPRRLRRGQRSRRIRPSSDELPAGGDA
ncbi:hypothetical protein [Haloarchaeobius sp. TZWSO28]|uniref:hypothetical protein n=1 Tax=Haloarchaeobius sp. TZWSO28 TaxID=3446119 RepID=UPI003EC06D25